MSAFVIWTMREEKTGSEWVAILWPEESLAAVDLDAGGVRSVPVRRDSYRMVVDVDRFIDETAIGLFRRCFILPGGQTIRAVDAIRNGMAFLDETTTIE